MRITRRQFIGLVGAAGLSSCARMGLDKVADMDVMPGGPGRFTFATIGDIFSREKNPERKKPLISAR